MVGITKCNKQFFLENLENNSVFIIISICKIFYCQRESKLLCEGG